MLAQLHALEEQRLEALRSFDILDTPREDEFDEVVRVTSMICDTPISVINLIDEGRQWFKAEIGLNTRETPIDSSICAHAILQPGLFMVNDTTKDHRLSDNPLVTGEPHLRFYAGALLETSGGLPLGTVCVLDYRPRELNQIQQDFLRLMAAQVMKQLELRRMAKLERAARIEAEQLLGENAMLLREIDHRVMNSLQLVSSILALQRRSAASDETKSQLESAGHRVNAIASVHRQLHSAGPQQPVRSDQFFTRLCEGLRAVAPASIDSMTLRFDELSDQL